MDDNFQIQEWIVSPKLNSLRSNGRMVRVEPKVMQVLVCLAQSSDVVSKEKLMRTVWADTFVTDDVLTRSISELRKVFDDDRKNPRYIQTIPKGGYRLIAPVEEVKRSAYAERSPAITAPEFSAEKSRRNIWPGVLIGSLVLLLAAYAISRHNATSAVPVGRAMLAVLPFQISATIPDRTSLPMVSPRK